MIFINKMPHLLRKKLKYVMSSVTLFHLPKKSMTWIRNVETRGADEHLEELLNTGPHTNSSWEYRKTFDIKRKTYKKGPSYRKLKENSTKMHAGTDCLIIVCTRTERK